MQQPKTPTPQRIARRWRHIARLLTGCAVVWGLSLSAALHTHAQEPAAQNEEEVDPLELAAVLVAGGDHERAAEVLDAITPDPNDDTFDATRYHTLSALAHLRLEHHEVAVGHLIKARSGAQDIGQKEQLSLLLAQAHFALRDDVRAIEALDAAGEIAASNPRAHMMRVQAHLRLGDQGSAWTALGAALERHPADRPLVRQRLHLLAELGLYGLALEHGQRFLQRGDVTADDWVTLAEIMRRAGRYNEAIEVLEEANLRFEHDARLLVLLARTYADIDMPLAAARIYERAAWLDAAYADEAAETYRRAGWHQSALHLGALVPDPLARARLRLSMLVSMERYEEAVALEPALRRLGLLPGDESVAYAMAYVLFMTRRYGRADRHLDGITDPRIFANAAELRRAMAACQRDARSCP